jgi:heat shock protein HtpX
MKRIILFLLTNLVVIVTVSVLLHVLGIGNYVKDGGLDYGTLAAFCAVWGFAGAFISLAISRWVAKWTMNIQVIDPDNPQTQEERWLVERVHDLSRKAGLLHMPEVGYYQSDEVNAFATGPSKKRSLVAVSTGLMGRMDRRGVEGVLGHEVAHIANGDMVTMTLIQGVINAFVMFIARVIAFAVMQFLASRSNEAPPAWIQPVVVIVLEIVLSVVGMMVVAWFSRQREYRADIGGADLAGRQNMIAALSALKAVYGVVPNDGRGTPAMKISGGGMLKLFSTHPDLDDRIARLQNRA